MMLKRFGTFALLAVCLFAMGMGENGCGNGNGIVNGGCIDGAAVDRSDFVDLSGVYSYVGYEGSALVLGGSLALFPSDDNGIREAKLWFLNDEFETSDESSCGLLTAAIFALWVGVMGILGVERLSPSVICPRQMDGRI